MLIHGDLNPTNVLVDPETWKIILNPNVICTKIKNKEERSALEAFFKDELA